MSEQREKLGRRVRDVLAEWAKTQPKPRPEWILPWDKLEERHKEFYRRVGSALWADFVAEFSEQAASAAIDAINKVHGGNEETK